MEVRPSSPSTVTPIDQFPSKRLGCHRGSDTSMSVWGDVKGWRSLEVEHRNINPHEQKKLGILQRCFNFAALEFGFVRSWIITLWISPFHLWQDTLHRSATCGSSQCGQWGLWGQGCFIALQGLIFVAEKNSQKKWKFGRCVTEIYCGIFCWCDWRKLENHQMLPEIALKRSSNCGI